MTHLLSVWSNESEVSGDINKVCILPVQALIQGSPENQSWIQLCNLCRNMWGLPGELGLTVIDDLPETIGGRREREGYFIFLYVACSSLGRPFRSPSHIRAIQVMLISLLIL